VADAVSKAFQVMVGRFRVAILMTRELNDTAKRIALFMLERSNRKKFEEDRGLYSWLSEHSLAVFAGVSDRAVRKARQQLRFHGVIADTLEGGQGAGQTTVYVFLEGWLRSTEYALETLGVLNLWNGGRGNAGSPFGDTKGERSGQIRGNNRSK
jgi:hypothetical protein